MKKILAILLVLVISIGLLSGCGDKDPRLKMSKKELIANIDKLTDDIDTLEIQIGAEGVKLDNANKEIEQLKETMKGIGGESAKSPGIIEFQDGTGRLTFNSVNSIIDISDHPFEYPHSIEISKDTNIKLSTDITIQPNANWIVNIDDNKSYYENINNNIYGTVAIAGFVLNDLEIPNVSDIPSIIEEYFSNVTHDNISGGSIYSSDGSQSKIGVNATLNTKINEEDARIICGMMKASSGVNLVYLFVYKGAVEQNKDEAIMTLLSTIAIRSYRIKIQ